MKANWKSNTDEHPTDGTRCWIYINGQVELARADSKAGGGWCNGDTWEDFGQSVTHFMIADVPNSPEQMGSVVSSLFSRLLS